MNWLYKFRLKETPAEKRARECIERFEKLTRKLAGLREARRERLVLCSRDLCIWMRRDFGFSVRRLGRPGMGPGILIIQFGWAAFSVRH